MKKEYMTPKEVARYDPWSTRRKPIDIEAKRLLGKKRPDLTTIFPYNDPKIELAKEILLSNFLGLEAIRKMEEKLKSVGVNVEFYIDRLPPFPYTENDLRLAGKNEELLVLRTNTMFTGGKETPVTIMALHKLFITDPIKKSHRVFYQSAEESWYKDENFANQPDQINLRWAMVKKSPLINSCGQTWDHQVDLLREYQKELIENGADNTEIERRTAMETVWDVLLYYTNTRKPLLNHLYDWGSSRVPCQSHSDGLVFLGGFQDGLGIGNATSGYDFNRGVCPTR